jgi:hypothetical protein
LFSDKGLGCIFSKLRHPLPHLGLCGKPLLWGSGGELEILPTRPSGGPVPSGCAGVGPRSPVGGGGEGHAVHPDPDEDPWDRQLSHSSCPLAPETGFPRGVAVTSCILKEEAQSQRPLSLLCLVSEQMMCPCVPHILDPLQANL